MANLIAADALFIGNTTVNKTYYGASQIWPVVTGGPVTVSRIFESVSAGNSGSQTGVDISGANEGDILYVVFNIRGHSGTTQVDLASFSLAGAVATRVTPPTTLASRMSSSIWRVICPAGTSVTVLYTMLLNTASANQVQFTLFRALNVTGEHSSSHFETVSAGSFLDVSLNTVAAGALIVGYSDNGKTSLPTTVGCDNQSALLFPSSSARHTITYFSNGVLAESPRTVTSGVGGGTTKASMSAVSLF